MQTPILMGGVKFALNGYITPAVCPRRIHDNSVGNIRYQKHNEIVWFSYIIVKQVLAKQFRCSKAVHGGSDGAVFISHLRASPSRKYLLFTSPRPPRPPPLHRGHTPENIYYLYVSPPPGPPHTHAAPTPQKYLLFSSRSRPSHRCSSPSTNIYYLLPSAASPTAVAPENMYYLYIIYCPPPRK